MHLQHLKILNYVLLAIILIIQGILLVMPFLVNGKLFYKANKTLRKKIPFRGRVFFSLAFLLIIITITQNLLLDNLNEQKDEIKDKEFKRDAFVRDSLNQNQNEIRSLKTQEMLAKYGYKVDSTNNVIVKTLRDSSLRKTTMVIGETPLLSLCDFQIERQENYNFLLNITLCSQDASSYNVSVKVDIIGVDSLTNADSYRYLDKNLELLAKNTFIPKNYEVICPVNISRKNASFTAFVIRIHGNYEKSDKTKRDIDALFMSPIDYRKGSFQKLPPGVDSKLREFINKVNPKDDTHLE